MPSGEGWFIDVKTGKAIPVFEHETAVLADPRRFRVCAVEVEGKNRAQLLKLVFQRGFIRVRWVTHDVVFELHGGREKALRLIRRFLIARGAGLYTYVRLHDLADRKFRLSGYWQELRSRWPPR